VAEVCEEAAGVSPPHIVDDGMQLEELGAAPVGIVDPFRIALVHALDMEQDFVIREDG